MRLLIFRVLSNPWGFRLVSFLCFTATMLGLRAGLHAMLDVASHAGLALFALIYFPALFGFCRWWDRRGY